MSNFTNTITAGFYSMLLRLLWRIACNRHAAVRPDPHDTATCRADGDDDAAAARLMDHSPPRQRSRTLYRG